MTIHTRFRGALTDHPAAEGLKSEIGGLVINAGAVELLVDLMIATIRQPPPDMAALRKMKYADRVKMLLDLAAKRPVSKALQKRLANAIDQAAEIMQVRNKIAHGALGLIFRGEADRGDLVGVGVLDLKGSKSLIVPAYTRPQIAAAQNAAEKVARTLEGLYGAIKTEIERDAAAPPSPPPPSPRGR